MFQSPESKTPCPMEELNGSILWDLAEKLNSYLMMPLNNILDCLKELITESQDFHLLLILPQKDLLQEWLLNSLEITKLVETL